MAAHALDDEEGRLAAIVRYGLADARPHDALDRIAGLARDAVGAPMAAISILDRTQQRFLAVKGIENVPLEREEALAARVVASEEPLVLTDCTAQTMPGVRAYLGVPIVSGDGYRVGVLEIMDRAPRAFTGREVAMATELARLVMDHLANRQIEDRDVLTGALTRRRFQAVVEREFERATRYDRPAALIFFDVDGFGEINAALGIDTANEILKTIANRAIENLRFTDGFGRIGGGQFGMLLPETLAYEASQCAERMREEIARLRFRNDKGVFSVTASFGIAPLNRGIKSAVHWFAQADVALYGAKQSGRDCVVFAPAVDEAVRPPATEMPEPAIDHLH